MKGDGRLGAPWTDVERDGGNAEVGGFVPDITSDIEGKDCRWGSFSSGLLLGSTGEMMPGMFEPAAERE